MYQDRQEAGELLAAQLGKLTLIDPVVLGIPRGGVEIAAALAKKLKAQLGVVVVKKIRSPSNPELAIGAVAEGGRSYLSSYGKKIKKQNPEYLKSEIETQTQAVKQRCEMFEKILPRSDWSGRSVILTDDGIATGATFLAALQVVRAERALEVIVAVPVLSTDMVKKIGKLCDKLIFLEAPQNFEAVGQFYLDFQAVSMDRVELLLNQYQSRYQERMN